MSRIAATALALLAPAAGAAPPPTAEQAMTAYRTTFKPVDELDCPKAPDGEIVVCGRPDGAADPHRLPLPIEREPGEVARPRGEAGGGAGMVSGCIYACPPGFGINLDMAKKALEGAKALIRGDD